MIARTTSPYFPKGLFGENEDVVSPLATHVESVLSALNEGPLYQKEEKPPLRVYRFTWLRAFHPATVVTLSFGPHLPAHLAVRSLSPNSMLPQFPCAEDRGRAVDDQSVDSLVQAFRRVQFLGLPSYEPKYGVTLDGAMWIIEAVEPSVYHAVYRHSPESGPIRELGMEFLRLAGLTDEQIY
jgi:hypothetical protein